jgi:alkylhydroperoxidase family enzyme
MVDQIPEAQSSSLFTPQEKAVVASAIELTRKAELSNETFESLIRHFNERQLVELVVAIGVANMNNRITDAFWADIEEAE